MPVLIPGQLTLTQSVLDQGDQSGTLIAARSPEKGSCC
jgi:hypothetical protein